MPRCEHPPAVELRVESRGRDRLVWSDDRWRPRTEWFDPAWFRARGLDRTAAAGRGAACYGELDGVPVVLRHYRRGGAVRGVLGDRYFWRGLGATRAWREFALLTRLHAAGLPVPTPIAARIQRPPPPSPFYRADLLTHCLAGTCTLAEALGAGALDPLRWQAVGRTVARFHVRGVDHADLNAHNILLGRDGSIYLIDFDRGRLRAHPGRWCTRNLARLHRSLTKLAGLEPRFHFGDADWGALLRGYQAECVAAPGADHRRMS